MRAYELHALLTHLTLTGQDEEGNLEFVGTNKKWRKAKDEIQNYETFALEEGIEIG